MNFVLRRRTVVALPLLAMVSGFTGLRAAVAPASPVLLELAHRDGRRTRYRMFLPTGAARAGVVLFSHGAKGSSAQYDAVLRPWADAGLVVIAPDHIDHDDATLAPAVARTLWPTRLADMLLPPAQPGAFDAAAARAGIRINWKQMAVAGHSYGGLVAQVLAGGRSNGPQATTATLPVSCVVALSPPGPIAGFVPDDSWAAVSVPALLQTGTADVLPGFIDDWQRHRAGFEPRLGTDRVLLIGTGVDHFFGGLICKPDPKAAPRTQAEALVRVAALSGAFLRAHLLDDTGALTRLDTRPALAAPTAGLAVTQLSSAPAPSVSAGGFRREYWRGTQMSVHRARRAESVLVFLPGAACAADRYEWLGPLAAAGTTVIIVDVAAGAGLEQLQHALERARLEGARLFLAGHSAGAALALDALDPASAKANPRLALPSGYVPPQDIAGIAVLGSSLQPHLLNFTLPYRREDGTLARPRDAPILFVSGDHDNVAPPATMARTRARYAAPTTLVELSGATHYGFAQGHQSTDNPAADRAGVVDTTGQRARTLQYLRRWLHGQPLAALTKDRVAGN